MLLRNKVEDPIGWQALQVTDIATARYALKLANDQYYAVIHMRAQMEKELARSQLETTRQSLKILQRFLTETHYYSSGGSGYFVEVPISYVPEPLPEPPVIPQWAYDAIIYMREQLVVERERAEAELADQIEDLDEMRTYLEGLVKEWFIAEVQASADWLNDAPTAVWGGCTLTYADGEVTFSYAELDYGD